MKGWELTMRKRRGGVGQCVTAMGGVIYIRFWKVMPHLGGSSK